MRAVPATRQRPIALRAQRLWALERPLNAVDRDRLNAFRFVSAMAILGDDVVRIAFIRSCDAHHSTAECLATSRVRLNLERNATAFDTLDAALAWAECRKRAWMRQGWTDCHPDRREARARVGADRRSHSA